jgi:serpin B
VNVVQKAGRYTLVRSEDGVQAYVASDALKQVGDTAMDVAKIVEGDNRFALELYQQLRAGKGNLFLSPSSISMALAMTYAGAHGQTEAEMAKTLHFEMPKPELDDGMQRLLSLWKTNEKKKGYRLLIANRLWGQEDYEFLPAFLEITRTKYGAELARLDFTGKTEESRRTINLWVEDQTEDKITDLIPAGALRQDSRLVLTNAVYFKGDWTEPFDKKGTRDEDFHVTATEKVKVPLMHQQDEFHYAALDGLQVLELPYGDKSLSVVVLLPEKVDGLSDLEAKLTHGNLQRWTSALRPQEVVVYLPRFRTTASFELNDTLKEMGMPSAFDALTADFSGMTGGRDLFIWKVIHKAFIDVNEEGTEAAAATGTIMVPTAARVEKPKPVFRADHPFVLMIRDNRNGAILFLGRLTNPTT